jgi:hypothetical protein
MVSGCVFAPQTKLTFRRWYGKWSVVVVEGALIESFQIDYNE